MGTSQLITCPLPYAACASRRAKRAKPKLPARLAKVAIALAVLYAMFNGERWLLEHSPASANELVVATCVVGLVFGEEVPANACNSAGEQSRDE